MSADEIPSAQFALWLAREQAAEKRDAPRLSTEESLLRSVNMLFDVVEGKKP